LITISFYNITWSTTWVIWFREASVWSSTWTLTSGFNTTPFIIFNTPITSSVRECNIATLTAWEIWITSTSRSFRLTIFNNTTPFIVFKSPSFILVFFFFFYLFFFFFFFFFVYFIFDFCILFDLFDLFLFSKLLFILFYILIKKWTNRIFINYIIYNTYSPLSSL